MPNKFDTIKAFVLANPSASWWAEEALFRGAEGPNGGVIKGAHVIAAVKYTEPDGDVRVRSYGPMPVNDLPNGITMAQTLQVIRISQQNTIEQQTATIAAKETAIAQHLASIAARDVDLAAKQTELAARQADIVARDAEIDAKQAEIERLTQELADANVNP